MKFLLAVILLVLPLACAMHWVRPTVEPIVYLVQSGQHSSDAAAYRKFDWPAPGRQASDSVLLPDGRVLQTFDFAPFGSFDPATGDGGQVAELVGNGAVFTKTRDGGKPYDQFFVGPRCGGTGWIAFRNYAPTGRWEEEVATLRDDPDPNACPSLDRALTRYRAETIDIPFILDGVAMAKTLSTVVSEHYGAYSIAAAGSMERSYFALGWGLTRWEAWSKTRIPSENLGERCPAIAYGAAPPGDGWKLVDCRHWTNIVAQPSGSGWAVDQFGWR